MNKKILTISGILTFVILTAFLSRAYLGENKKSEAAPAKKIPSVSAVAAKSGSISKAIELDGTVEAVRFARMSSPAEGPVTHCHVREGDRVTKGQPVIDIGRDKTINAQLAAAHMDLNREKSELDRVKKLVENGAIPGDQLDIARSRYENAKAQTAKVQESRADYRITAPWNGITSRVMVVEGDYVAPRTPLVEIFDPASLIIRFAVPEAESQSVHTGKTVAVKLDAYPGKTFSATVNRVYPKLDPGTRTRIVEAAVVEKTPLMPGLFARIKLDVQTHADTVLVPAEAVLVNAKGERLAYVIKEGKALQRKVSTGIEADRMLEILSGIKPGEKVVVAGNEKLKDGVAVKVSEKKDGPGGKKNGGGAAKAAGKDTPQ